MSESRGRGSGDSSWRTRRSYGVGSDGGSAAFSECGTRSSGSGTRGPVLAAPALTSACDQADRRRAMISWHGTYLDPPWALLPLEPRVRSLVGHFGLASIGTERTPHRPAYIIG